MNFLNETVGRLAARLILEFRSAEDDMREFGRLYKDEYGVGPNKVQPYLYTVPLEPDAETVLRQVVVLMLGLGYRKGKTYEDGSVDLYKRIWMAKVIAPGQEGKDVAIGWIKAPTIKVPASGWHPAVAKEPATQEQ